MKSLTAAAAAVLLTTSAFAQQAPSSNPSSGMPSPSRPAGNQGGAPGTNSATDTTGNPDTSSNRATNASNPGHYLTNQGQDQWLVGNLWNKSVYNAAGKSIGDLNDVLIDKDGKVAALVVGVGGFLGLGEKNVAVDFDQIKQSGGISGNRIVVGLSEQDLRNAPAFQRNSSNSGSASSNR